ncbi:MAG: hypothetical protein IPJ01_11700 [Micavibrio sp.]|nr:hypothetical protein [Micavibrio sp.]
MENQNQNENNENEEMEIQHRLYIEEEEINISELPNEIKQAMRNFNAKLKKYEDSEDEAEQNELFYELQQDDVAIADDILTWWEDKNSEDEEEVSEEEEEQEEEKKEPVKTNTAQPKAEVKTPQPNAEVKTPQPVEEVKTPPAPQVNPAEQKVRDLIKNNIISVNDLTNAIGGDPEYPEHQVGKLRLRKQYLKPFYEVQN